MAMTPTLDSDAEARLIANAGRRLSSVDTNLPSQLPPAPPPRSAPVARKSAPPRPKNLLRVQEEFSGQCPFRRSHSKPENPMSDMATVAIAEETASSRIPRMSPKKLTLLRRFSVSEEDVVICNRVRCGVDPVWFRGRPSAQNNQRFQRSLSIEEAGLVATRKRLGLTGRAHKPSTPLLPFTVLENEPAEEPSLVLQPNPKPLPVEEDDRARRYTTELGPAPLTPREKAMHGRYLIRESLANGSYGQVCAAEDLPSHQEVAVKIIPKYILVSPEEKQSVIREQLIHKSLDHPHIIKLIDVFEDEGAHYFILERADHGSLSTLITYSGMPEDQSRDVFRQLLQALEYLHRNNIVHHDIKPHNILLHKGGDNIKLCDFGASRAFNAEEASLPFAGVFGTPGYIAPELLLGEKAYGPAIDMFSAGILLYEMVFGYAPFYPPSACTYQRLDFPPKTPASPETCDLIGRLLEKDPALRITASQALGHPWITRGCPGRSAPNSPVVSPRHATLLSPCAGPGRPYERCFSS